MDATVEGFRQLLAIWVARPSMDDWLSAWYRQSPESQMMFCEHIVATCIDYFGEDETVAMVERATERANRSVN